MGAFSAFLDILFPPRCVFCRKILADGEKGICKKCCSLTPKLKADECRRDVPNVKICVFPFRYKDEVRASLLRYKFGGAAAYGPVYADFIAKSIDENGISCDIICWVPLHKKRLRERGYDQAEIIARALSKKLGVPCRRLLVKESGNKRQSSIDNREERKANVSGVYRCVSKEELIGKRVLLVDDIITSGATVGECAAMLKAFGCTEIYSAAFAAATS